MPSPIAHGFAGLALAEVSRWCRARRSTRERATGWPLLAALVIFAANAPDLDFLPGILAGHPDWLHRGRSHSLLAAFLFGAVIYGLARMRRLREAGFLGWLTAAAYASHVMLDALSPDPLRFNGVPAFWPLSNSLFVVSSPVFLDIRRDPTAGDFLSSLWSAHNMYAVLREMLIVGGFLLVGRTAAKIFLRTEGMDRKATRARLDPRVDSES